MIDELRMFDILLPYDLERQIGYDPIEYNGRTADYIAFWWTSDLDDPMITDGYLSYTGDSRGFVAWDHNAGEKILRNVDFDTKENSNPPLTQLLVDYDLDMGNADDPETSAFVFSIVDRELYIGDRETVKEFCRDKNDPPENIEELPDDPICAANELRKGELNDL